MGRKGALDIILNLRLPLDIILILLDIILSQLDITPTQLVKIILTQLDIIPTQLDIIPTQPDPLARLSLPGAPLPVPRPGPDQVEVEAGLQAPPQPAVLAAPTGPRPAPLKTARDRTTAVATGQTTGVPETGKIRELV